MKNFWSLHPGEALVADEIQKHRKDLEVFFPIKDKAVDFIVAKNLDSPKKRKLISIQVKESRQYEEGHCWLTVNSKYLKKGYERVDHYVFVLYNTVPKKHKLGFEINYIIVPTKELLKRLGGKHIGRGKGGYDFYFTIKGKEVIEHRDKIEYKYSKFLNNWGIIK